MRWPIHELWFRFTAIALALLLFVSPATALPASVGLAMPAEEEDGQTELTINHRIAEPARPLRDDRPNKSRTFGTASTHRVHKYSASATEPPPESFDAERNIRLHC